MSSLLFGGSSTKPSPSEAATRTACSKLANNAALVVNELAREPAQGLMHVVVRGGQVWLCTCDRQRVHYVLYFNECGRSWGSN